MSESTICVKCKKPKQGGLECPTCGVIYAKAEAALLVKSASVIGLENEREKKRRTLGILAVLLVVLAGITSWQVYRMFVIDKTANIIPTLPVKDDPNLAHNYIPCAGVAVIDHDRSFTDTSSFNGPTFLDTMDLGQIANYRKAKVRKMAQLNFFHQGYDPFEPPHNRIYGQIIPKVAWVAAVPYYIANPYILLSLTHANSVAPFTVFLKDSEIVYSNGRITESHTGRSFAIWQEFLDGRKRDMAVVMVNAWDAGFYYVHLVESLCENIVPAIASDNVGKSLYSQSSLYHVGQHLKNNISPDDPRSHITLRDNSIPTKLVFHLWRNKPPSINVKPDLIYEMAYKP